MIIAVSLGIIVGIITGLLPGLGMITTTLVFMPILLELNPTNIILWYATVLITHQFVGGMVAIYYGVPAQESDWPAVLEGHQLYKRGLANFPIQAAAISHVISLTISLIMMLTISHYATQIAVFFDTKIQILIIVATIIGVTCVTSEPMLIKILMVTLGTFFGFFGELNRSHLHFNLEIANDINFSDGIPVIPLLIGLFALPTVLKNNQDLIITSHIKQIKAKFVDFKYYITSFFYSFVGLIFGLTPMVTSDVAANLSYNIHKWFKKTFKQYKKDGDISTIVAAESAAASGAIVSLMPLLLFGIPITASEALIYTMMIGKGYVFSITNYNTMLLPQILGCLIFVGIIDYFISGPFSEFFSKLYVYLKRNAVYLIVFFLFCSAFYQGYHNYLLKEYLITMTICFIIGYTLKEYNLNLFVFCFLLGNHTFDIFQRGWTFFKIFLENNLL